MAACRSMTRQQGSSFPCKAVAKRGLTRIGQPSVMAEDRTVELELPHRLLLALGRAAESARVRPSAYLCAVLEIALDREGFALPGAEEEVRIALHLATGWPDLQKRLRAQGRVLRAGEGGELFLHTWPEGRRLLPLALFGESRAGLTLRFATDFPPATPLAAFRSCRVAAPDQPRAA